MNSAPTAGDYEVPIRRTRWTRFWVGRLSPARTHTPIFIASCSLCLKPTPKTKTTLAAASAGYLIRWSLCLRSDNWSATEAIDPHYVFAKGVAITLTYEPTREMRRKNERGIALVDQAMRFAQADGWPAEESLQTSTARKWFQLHREQFHASAWRARQQAFRDNLKLMEFPVKNAAEAERQTMLVQALGEGCPDYLVELQAAGFAGEQILYPEFSHRYHVAVIAARAIQQGRADRAEAAFAAWLVVQPVDLYFPTKEFAEAVYELKVDSALAASLVPERQRNYFGHCLKDANPDNASGWGY